MKTNIKINIKKYSIPNETYADMYRSLPATIDLSSRNGLKKNISLRKKKRMEDKLNTPIVFAWVFTLAITIIYLIANSFATFATAFAELDLDPYDAVYDQAEEIIVETIWTEAYEELKEETENKETFDDYSEEMKAEHKDALDLDKLAYAVAMAETHDCTKGYGATHNNCFGIKNANTAPCDWPKMVMCRYNDPSESYEAFKKIWWKWYKKFPDRSLAVRWTGNDRADSWLEHVTHYYNK